jgi:thiazole synthase
LRKLSLQIGVQSDFHRYRLGTGSEGVNRVAFRPEGGVVSHSSAFREVAIPTLEGQRNSLERPAPFRNFHYNTTMSDPLIIAGRQFHSRLIVGTGKYRSFQETARALEASGAEMVTVAVRRVNLDRSKESLLDFIDPKKYFLLPNTAGCYTADEAIRTARLGREVGISDWVKIEVIGDQATLYPDVQATLEATRTLVKEGFVVLPYTSDDIVFAKRLVDAGASAVMPLGAPIGSGLGIQNAANIRILREMITGVPLILDAGVGTASDATLAMELGADAVLMNTGIAAAQEPVLMAEAMKHAVLAGRQAYLAGRMGKKLYATASSPVENVVR